MKKPPRKAAADAVPAEIDPQVAALGFEEAVEQLEAIIERMERGEQILDQAEQRIEAISGQTLDAGARPEAAEPPF
jgi:exonuclease VII small subunit